MELKELNNNFLNLKRDYDCCQLPQWGDPVTLRTIDNIAYDIKQGRLSIGDFRLFVEKHLGQGDFAWGCLQYVENNI